MKLQVIELTMLVLYHQLTLLFDTKIKNNNTIEISWLTLLFDTKIKNNNTIEISCAIFKKINTR